VVNFQQVPIDLIGSSTFGLHHKISSAQTWNMFVTDGWFNNYPGYKRILELTSSLGLAEGRGALKSTRGNCGIVAVGDSIYQLISPTNANFIGNIKTFSGPVFMAENLNSQVGIVDGLNFYIYNRDFGTLTKQSIPEALIPNYIRYHDTYFLLGNANTTGNGAEWFVFSYASATTVSVTYTLSLSNKSDFARAVVPLPGKGNNVLVLGESTGEIHNNVGGAQGYARVSTISIDYGTVSVETIATHEVYTLWIATNESTPPILVMFDGQSLKKIATDGINNVLSNIINPSKSLGFIFSVGNHLFYQFTFYDQKDNKSFIYDISNDKFYNLSDYNIDAHPARQILYLGNNTYFVSFKNGSIYEMNLNLTTQDENLSNLGEESYKAEDNHVIPQIRITSTFRKPDSTKFIGRRFTLTIEQGNDLAYSTPFPFGLQENIVTEAEQEDIVSQDGEQLVTENKLNNIGNSPFETVYKPCLDLSISKDGGDTYSSDVRRDLNMYGDRQNILNFNQLAQANEMTFKFKFWGLTRFTSTGGVFYYT